MDAQLFHALWQELGRVLQMVAHDGGYDRDKELWQQEDDEIQQLWRRITHPQYREALRSMLAEHEHSVRKPELQEACRQSDVRFIEAFPESDEARSLRETGLPTLARAEAAFWAIVARKGLARLRWLRRPASAHALDARFATTELAGEWEQLKSQMQSGDQLWPFKFDVQPHLGRRRGYVLLRQGRAVGGIVTNST